MKVEIADWLDLDANTTVPILEVDQFDGQAIEVTKLGGRPNDSVFVEADATFTGERGEDTETTTPLTRALGDFNFPLQTGPTATERFVWRAINESATNFTDGNNNPYQAFLGYNVRPITVIEKMRRGLTLTNQEEDLATRVLDGQIMSLQERQRLNVPPEVDPAFLPNLEGKNVIETDAVATSVDIATAGTDGAVTIADERVERNPRTGLDSDVIYLKRIGGNWAEFSETENIKVSVKASGTDEILRVKTFGLPGIGTGSGVTSGVDAGTSQPPYLSDYHIPFLDRMIVEVFSDTTNQTPNGIEVRVEFARVERTLVEKALYGLEDEVKANDELAQDRLELFNKLEDMLRAGVPLTPEIRTNAQEMAATGR